jgi:NAD+ synthetase
MGIGGYGRKTGFRRAVLGLSGGIDSAVVACLAAEALGPSNVLGVGMPGPYSAPESLRDAGLLAQRLGIGFRTVPIVPVYEAYLRTLAAPLEGRPFDVTEENVQARIRGNVLMAISNKLGHLVLTTGNKSELAVGYCTLYGDMCGGLAPISDVWKMRVYDVARTYGRDGETIPRHTISRPPSAELRPEPDRPGLAAALRGPRPHPAGPRRARSRSTELVAAGEDPVPSPQKVLRLVERSEYKRRQMAPGLKVSPLAFGIGWRMPIARPTDLSGER